MPLSGAASGRPLMIGLVSRLWHLRIFLATFRDPAATFPQLIGPFCPTRRRNLGLNQVEIWFGIITRQAIRRGTFGSVRLLIQVISNYIASWNEDSAPFEWTATAADIIEKVALVDRDFRKLLACNL
jgi:hypothetical protein